jgi:gluconokinase
LRFIHLHGDRALLEQRLQYRTGHYMPPSLLTSQLQTLEPPSSDEPAITLDIALPTEQLVAQIEQQLQLQIA